MRRFSLAFLMSLLAVMAAPAYAEGGQASAAGYVESIGQEALKIISDASFAKDQKQLKLEALFSDSVDIDWVGKFVLGRYWRQITPEQKPRYLAAYKKFLIRHYTSRFVDYTGGTFKVTGARKDGEGEYTVNMSLMGDAPGSEEVFVDYRLHDDAGKTSFKVFDVIVEGVSLIATQRSEFASVVGNKGIDHLIAQLEAKSAPAEVTKKN